MIGKTISHYKVLKKLGEGGMGVVYRANDTKLGREVAIKVLPEEFERDLERLARFEREAKLLASLNHSNIAAIYGLEEHESLHFLVLEVVRGDTLAERVTTKPLEVQEALEICSQIAEALEAAHEKGIIHRDLKPSNVKVTPEGKVKVLDFGLAKAFEAADYGGISVVDPSKSPTITIGTSKSRIILGTAAYMSPEQARGKPLDKRTDIWSFGCVLYEVLTGRQAFKGETISDTIAAILEHEPDWEALPKVTPVKIRDILRRCLQKDINRRFRDIADIRIEIEEVLSEVSAPLPATPETEGESLPIKRLRPAFLKGLVAGLAIGTIVTGIILWNLMRTTLSEQQAVGRYTIDLPPEAPVEIYDLPSVALSPDGTSLVYAADRGESSQLYLRDIKQLEAKPIPGTERAHGPFFSPSGEWVGYFDYEAGKLMKVSLRGGAPIVICKAPPNSRGASWGSDDSIVFTRSYNSGLYRVPAVGGTLQVITTLDPEKKEKTHRFPQILPDGKTVLFTIGTSEFTSYDDARIAIVSLKTGKRKTLVEGGTNARYAPSGHIVYARAGSLMAVPFNLKQLKVIGSPVRILEGVVTSDAFGAAQFNFSPNGSLIYVTGGPEAYYTKLVWVDRKGDIQSLPVTPRIFNRVSNSPDGKRLALQFGGGNEDVWIYEIEREILTRLTAGWDDQRPIWTPDSNRVTYQNTRGELYTLFWKPADGSAPAEKLITGEHNVWPDSWSPDGKMLAFTERHPSTGMDIWVLPTEGEGEPQLFLQTSFNETQAKFSPDGRWIAYTSDESGQYEVYVRPFPGPGRK